jgi:hypothetical protein
MKNPITLLLAMVLLAGCGSADVPVQPTTGSAGVPLDPTSAPAGEGGAKQVATPDESRPGATAEIEGAAEGGGAGDGVTGVAGGGVATAEAGVVDGGSIAPVATPTPIRGGRTITLADNQQTLELAVGETFALRLGEQFSWEVQAPQGDVLVPAAGGPLEPGEQGLYRAQSPGQVELIATGDPECAKSEPACMMPSMLFRLVVVVR